MFDLEAAFFVAVLGVARAGGFHIALDPAHPPERNRAILADTGAVIEAVIGDRPIDMTPRRLALAVMAASYEELLVSFGGWRPDPRATAVEGLEHLDRALAAGQGAILWRSPQTLTHAALALALGRRGYRFHVVGRPEHGLSPSTYGRRVLNRFVREDVVDRDDVVTVMGDGQEALNRVRGLLSENRIVSIRAGYLSDNPATLPFLGGFLELPTGAPRLALATGAALLPVFTLRNPDGSFRVIVEAMPAVEAAADRIAATERLLRHFARRLEGYVARDPVRWRYWHPRAEDVAEASRM